MAHYIKKEVPSKKGKTRIVWISRWKQDGKQREKSHQRKDDARRHSIAMQAQHEEKALTKVEEEALRDVDFWTVGTEFIDSLENPPAGKDPREPITIRGYNSLLIHHLIKELHGHPNDVTLADLERLRDRMFEDGQSFDRVRKALGLAKQILKYSIRQGLRVAAVPPVELEKPESVKRKEVEKADEVYSLDQLHTILRAADSLAEDRHKGTRRAWTVYRPMVYLLVHAGLRIGEARAFPRSAFDLTKGKVLVRQAASEDGTIKHPKTIGGRRDMPMHPDLPPVIEPLLSSHNHDLVFASSEGTARSLGNLYRGLWKPLMKRCEQLAQTGEERLVEVPSWGFHAIRHAYASRLIAGGANLKQLSRWMGHSDPAFTLRVYGHLMEDGHEEVMSKMAI
ncbi:Site-specific recombinase XerD [Palleronia salina]|uniref:Site-specific recombinase XerD n=1 Tax=Palleronia salina TaxID=313368 RepID=A0A1M6M4X4_9RHOB|nr:site-specific integrase [Palleronia salina]SHJ78511.1 Site-specific recombinase XerD [Palleronia salina]